MLLIIFQLSRSMNPYGCWFWIEFHTFCTSFFFQDQGNEWIFLDLTFHQAKSLNFSHQPRPRSQPKWNRKWEEEKTDFAQKSHSLRLVNIIMGREKIYKNKFCLRGTVMSSCYHWLHAMFPPCMSILLPFSSQQTTAHENYIQHQNRCGSEMEERDGGGRKTFYFFSPYTIETFHRRHDLTHRE